MKREYVIDNLDVQDGYLKVSAYQMPTGEVGEDWIPAVSLKFNVKSTALNIRRYTLKKV